MPSLKPRRLRGVSCARLVDEVRPKPSCDQRTVTAPRPMRARLRTAWKATCGSSAHACTQRSPPLRARSSSSPGSAGRSRSGAGRWPASPKRSSKSAGPSPKVTVRRAGESPSASPVSCGGASATSLTSPTGRPAVMRSAACDHERSSPRTSWARRPSSTSKAAKCSRSCAGVAIPAWWRPWNATVASDRARRLGVVLAAQDEAAARRSGDPAARGGREQGPSRQARHRYPDSARAGACESGSASASITSLSRRTWGLSSAV